MADRLPTFTLPITGAGFALRAQRPEDADARFALHSNPDYVRFVGQCIDRARSDTELAHELSGDSPFVILVIADATTLAMIGECVFFYSTVGEAEFVIALLPEARGRGLAQAVALTAIATLFQDPYYTAVVACVDEANERAKRLVASLGMVFDGRVQRLTSLQDRYVLRKHLGA